MNADPKYRTPAVAHAHQPLVALADRGLGVAAGAGRDAPADARLVDPALSRDGK